MPLSIEKLSTGNPAICQALIFTGSPNVALRLKVSEQGIFFTRQSFCQSAVHSCVVVKRKRRQHEIQASSRASSCQPSPRIRTYLFRTHTECISKHSSVISSPQVYEQYMTMHFLHTVLLFPVSKPVTRKAYTAQRNTT